MGESSSSRQLRWSLQGMTALVTGGTKGIGRAIVEELAGFGAAVYTCCRTEKDLNDCLTQWKEAGLHVSGSPCDLSSRSAREELIGKASSFCNGKLNILINNVGTNIFKPALGYTAEEFSFIMSTNFESAYHMCQLSHPLLKASGNGSIVFMSSILGVVAVQSGSIYAANKGAMNQITKNLACEWASDKIRVNCVAPWMTKTQLIKELLADEEIVKKVLERTPLRRIAEPRDVSSLQSFGLRKKSFPYSKPQLHERNPKCATVASQLHGRRPMDVVVPVGHKSEALCMKSEVHLKDDSATNMEIIIESYMSKEV